MLKNSENKIPIRKLNFKKSENKIKINHLKKNLLQLNNKS